ncbi:ROK family protein [Siphonobacter aquaeclarae]|jgi:glucokinase|uniref:Glucokinase n=1 Tax=Siphonobacter aquaeclarae TaxID=563176 RepID=A0A1G9U5Y9_9BACT|nr:ROK family protein [Siphonobacter aquaeclarae]MBO9638598.1 ROK family protein [Siphonobacter aquaeclarae]SDM55351.1 glucokinase [Siphonobacter aquaeclarae]
MQPTAIGIDLGGTNIKGLLVSADGEIHRQHYIPTADTGDGSWKESVAEMVRYLEGYLQTPVSGVGISAPGLPDATNETISVMPGRLAGLEHFRWSEFLGRPARVINDAHAALMAEARFGNLRGYRNALLLTLGTGVGGGLLLDGRLYQGVGQMAGHLGHTVVDAGLHTRGITGMPGSLEHAIGNHSVPERTCGKYTSTWELVEAYRKGEPVATWAWLQSVQRLATALASWMNAFSPECIALAGGITLAEDALFDPLRSFLHLYEWTPGGKQTPIVQAHFGDMAGALGAAGFVLHPS